ncbi:MAG: hypothetical protein GQ561_06920 [Calditrichae bacterium]|nr:hypothetical protein [Calditrichia bacterium]
MPKNNFDIIMLLGRPASGKSEVIDYLKKTTVEERLRRFHMEKFEEIDDFPMLWTWFEEDAILEKIMKKPRINTDKDGYFLYDYQWHLLIERISLDYSKKLRDHEDYHSEYTALLEFSRGSEHGGYQAACDHLSEEILKKAAIVYVDVSYEESKRKNRRRFNPDKPDSILEHGLPDEKLERLYKEVDWEDMSAADPQYVSIKGFKVPYVIFRNEPEITDNPVELGNHLEEILQKLWETRKQ